MPVSRHISYFADWASGNNQFGIFSTGLEFTPTTRDAISFSYNTGNHGAGNNWLSITFGRTF